MSIKQERSSSLELYRILLMLLIIAHHYVVNSGLIVVLFNTNISINSLFLIILGAWGKTCINCFILITGYFMCKSHITIEKFLKLFLEIEFYKILFAAIFFLSGYSEFTWRGFIYYILPFTTIGSDFAGCFLCFYLLIPFLNILIANLNKGYHMLLICLIIGIYTIFPSLKFYVAFNYVTWFSVIYIIAAYIRIYPNILFVNFKFWILFSLINILLAIASILIIYSLKRNNFYFFLEDSNTIFALSISISLFTLFKNFNIPYNKIINYIAQSILGILLIHANSDTKRKWLWQDTLKISQYFLPDGYLCMLF